MSAGLKMVEMHVIHEEHMVSGIENLLRLKARKSAVAKFKKEGVGLYLVWPP